MLVPCLFFNSLPCNSKRVTGRFCSSRMSLSSVSAFVPTTNRNILLHTDKKKGNLSRNFYHSDDVKSVINTATKTKRTIKTIMNGSNTSLNNLSIKEQKYQELISCSKLSLAPMMEYTDRHFRKLVSLLSTNTLCYTEMVAANALVHERLDSKKKFVTGEHNNLNDEYRNQEEASLDIQEYGYDMSYIRRFLGQYSSSTPTHIKNHNPTVLQLGGSDPDMLQEATEIVTEVTKRGYCDYTAINLNCGCPSPKVAGKGNFGASLMNEPHLVRDIVQSMDKGTNSNIPITVKCRIGTDESLVENGLQFTKLNYQNIDEEEEYKKLCRFIDIVASSGVVTDFQIHARIAVLNKNFSPNDNRKIPSLKYHYVRRLVEDFPELTFSLNGGVDTLNQVKVELDSSPKMTGVMVGRAWAAQPWNFAMADELLYGDIESQKSKPKNRLEVLQEFGKYADYEEENWDPVKVRRFIIKAITPLFAGEPNGKKYRIALDEIASLPKKAATGKSIGSLMNVPVSELIMNAALDNVSEEILLRTPEESYERLLDASRNRVEGSSMTQSQSQIISEWQESRKNESLEVGS